MDDNLIKISNKYIDFLGILENRILEKEFEKQLLEMQNIDQNHYTKKINIDELKKCIQEYQNKEYIKNSYKNLQILLPGNPEIVFKLCLEAIRYDVNIRISIEDFCLAQNTLIVNLINEVIEYCRLKNIIEIKNMLKDEEIVKYSKNIDKTICIGNSNLYNRLVDKIENLEFYPYGILDLYSDSEEFEDLKKIIYQYAIENQFELEIYDELNFEEAIKAINRDSYKFCSLIISKDKEKIERFTKNIDSRYVIFNKNPFNEISFNLDIK